MEFLKQIKEASSKKEHVMNIEIEVNLIITRNIKIVVQFKIIVCGPQVHVIFWMHIGQRTPLMLESLLF